MKNLVFILVLLGITACSPIKRHNRLVEKYPFVHTQDTLVVHDTISVIVPEERVDTIFKIDHLYDTITIEKERLKIKLFAVHDSVYVEGQCDSIYVERIVERKIPIRYYEKCDKWNWLWWLVIIIGGIFVFYLISKYWKR